VYTSPGIAHTREMLDSSMRDRMWAFTIQGEDLPQLTNRVDLDPAVRDWRGFPAGRVTYSPHRHELVASQYYAPKLTEIMERAGARFTVFLAVGTGTMALMIVSQTSDPFRTAFEDQRGAHLQVLFDPRTDAGTLAGTPSLIGATAYGGPYRATDVQFQSGGHKYAVTAIGRDNPNGDVEQLRISAGHWPVSDNEIVLTRSFADLNHISVGDKIKIVSVLQEPVLIAVGALLVLGGIGFAKRIR